MGSGRSSLVGIRYSVHSSTAVTAIPPTNDLALDTRPRNLSDIVFEKVHQAILEKVLEPGESITEPGLAERLRVSKTPVREALLRLRQVGLIEADGPRGLRVVQLSADGVIKTYEIREALESFAARRAAESAAPEDDARILAAASRSHEAAMDGNTAEFRETNRELHQAIASVTDNPRLSQLIEDAEALISTLAQHDFPSGHGLSESGEAHLRIANAIVARDAEAAQREMARHIRQVRVLMLETLEGGCRAE